MSRSYKVFTDKNYAYFVTWTLVDWLDLFARAPYRHIVLDSLHYLRTEKKTQLNAFVIMSSHVHAILWPEIGISLSDLTRDFKRFTSRRISREAELQNEKEVLETFRNARKENHAQNTSTYQVWQEGSHPEAIFTANFARQKMDYIHMNPVKAGFVKRPEQWIYSSASAYLLDEQTYPVVDLLITG